MKIFSFLFPGITDGLRPLQSESEWHPKPDISKIVDFNKAMFYKTKDCSDCLSVYTKKRSFNQAAIFIHAKYLTDERRHFMKTGDYPFKPPECHGIVFFIFIIACIWASCFVTANLCYGFSLVSNETEQIKSAGNLYEKPSTGSKIIDQLKKGDAVTLIHCKNGWCIVKLSDDRLGWVLQNLFLETTEPVSEIPKENAAPIKRVKMRFSAGRVREAPSLGSDIKFTLQYGDVVSVIDIKEDWYYIRLNDGSAGWAHQSLFSDSEETPPSEPPLAAEASPETEEQEPSGAREIKDIRVDIAPEGEEKVIVALTGFYPPDTFVLEESVPKVVCDFFGVQLGSGISRQISVNGRLIQKIRIGVHDDGADSKIRVVTDLRSDRDYEVEQVFFKKENIYTLTFKPAPKN
jgi:SH3-like domain-containing protein